MDDDQFRPVRPEDVSDLALLPRRFDALANEVRSGFELLSNKLLPFMARMEHAIDDLASRVLDLERAKHAIHDRLAALEAPRAKQRKRKAK